MNIRLFPLFAIAISVISSIAHAEVDIDIEGLDGIAQDNVETYLAAIAPEERDGSYRFIARVEQDVRKALQAVGFYQPKITTRMDGDATLEVKVDPGKPVRLAQVDVVFSGEAGMDDDFHALKADGPQPGEILNHGDYDSLKSQIQSLAVKKGYFDGRFTQTRLEVSPTRQQAFIRLHFASGKRYHFGAIRYQGSQIQLQRLDTLRGFSPGDPYQVSALGEFNQALANTGWFSSALVQADMEEAEDTEVPIKVTLTPEARNKFETGIGYSTDIGPRLKFNWRKPWYNSRGHSITTSLAISEPEQTLTSTYKVPLEDVSREYYQVQLGLQNTEQRDTSSLEVSTSISRHWLYDTGWQRSVSLRWLYEDYTQGQDEDSVSVVLPGINFTRTRTRARGGLMPHWGDKQSIRLEAADPIWLSDISLVRLQGRSAWIRSLNKNHRGLLRVDGGALISEEFSEAPPSLRFFAGGDNSIRGYGYETVSPVDDSGQLSGARYMLTGTLEYQYRLGGNWWWALFADGGDAWTHNLSWKRAAGTGIRWSSPVGPIRLDIARGFDNDDDDFRIHLTLGPEL
ncbi:autotransporter assembly complex protein TamA [Salinivibrio proteolyticus]|uniref:Translocation and assembly module subunit TamA n=1 Tax=Salinivibrio proteolyticus TaxID=334715 RepID=A0ABY7LB74_9GAMM|nr:autotransporter assembly complex family protein [Salinivibrio proteolyticus]WBA14495.1 autotransporter assembly complex protein TamA [Salinivibrio proteolyticus]